MVRLSDLIKQGKILEKEAAAAKDERDKIRIRELAELKTKKETVVEEKRQQPDWKSGSSQASQRQKYPKRSLRRSLKSHPSPEK